MSDWLGTVGSPLLAAAGLASHLSCRWASFEKLYLNPRQQQVVDRTPVVVVGYASERASLYTRGFRAGTSAALLLILKQLLSLSTLTSSQRGVNHVIISIGPAPLSCNQKHLWHASDVDEPLWIMIIKDTHISSQERVYSYIKILFYFAAEKSLIQLHL